MDALDAGTYAYTFEAEAPKSLRVVLWGPLHAKELGFHDWTYQDGGETGFVYHTHARAVRMGLATATLIFVRRLARAYLTVYLGGYPSDAPIEQRRLDAQNLATEAELFLTRLAKQPIRFELVREVALAEPQAVPMAAPARTSAKPL